MNKSNISYDEIKKIYFEETLTLNEISLSMNISINKLRRIIKDFGWSRKKCSKWDNPEECKRQSERMKGENNPLFGIGHSEETRKKMSEAAKGKPGTPHTEESKLKCREAKLGTKFMNNGIEAKLLQPEEFETYLKLGWKFGMIKRKQK